MAFVIAAIMDEVKCDGYGADPDDGGGARPPLTPLAPIYFSSISRIFPRSLIIKSSFWSSIENLGDE